MRGCQLTRDGHCPDWDAQRLRCLDVRVAIDDFGTGYSSLAYLRRLPVDVLKVDKSFIDEVTSSVDGAHLTEAILSMSRNLHLTTVAEGVEQHEQADWLRRASCTLAQGYLWSRPLELAAVETLLVDGAPLVLSAARPTSAAPRAGAARRAGAAPHPHADAPAAELDHT